MPYKMPSVNDFLQKKRLYGPKREPVWVYLEKEMRQNEAKKPYNHLVGEWLKFLKDLKKHYHNEAVRARKRLIKDIGPSWYCELSTYQREILTELRTNIHQDLIEDSPVRVRKSLSDLGVVAKIPKSILMEAMKSSIEDPGVFIWNLYTAIYKRAPSELCAHYDMNAMLLMSALVFIDLDECIQNLEDLTRNDEDYSEPPPPPRPQNYKPDVKYGEYLEKCYVHCYYGKPAPVSKNKPKPINYKFKMRTENSYERLIRDHGFLEKRIERNRKEMQPDRICTYKFWEPPTSLRNKDPKMRSYLEKLKMFKLKPKVRHQPPFNNMHYVVGGVVYLGAKPLFMLQTLVTLPTGYIPINGGHVSVNDEIMSINILGYYCYPREIEDECDKTCDCMKWESTVMEYINNTKCKCGHYYDMYHEGKATEKFFYPPTAHGPLWFDYAKIYQMDSKEDFIKNAVEDAARSKEPTPAPSCPTISATGLKLRELLAIFLADLSSTPLLIPHLPQANLLNNLQEWVRRRVFGRVSPAKHKKWTLTSARRWLELKHMDFIARAYFIPFTLKNLHNMTWAHRELVQTLFKILLEDFVTRNRLKQMEQTRLWWPTMKYDTYPNKAFLDIFFTYMPGRMRDTYLINPYSSETTAKYGSKTCPLEQ